MKRLTALIVAVVLCLLVCGCGNGNNSGGIGGADTLSSAANANHPFLQNLYGRWDYSGDYADNYPFSTLEVFEDGTCLVDGQSGSWTMNGRTTDDWLYADILVNGEKISTIFLHFGWDQQPELGCTDLPVYPGDRWVNAEAALARKEAIMEEWGSDLYGQWEVFERDCVGMIEPLVFIEDGTVSIGDRVLGWEISENWSWSDTELDIIVYDGAEDLYEMKLWREEGDLHGQIYDGTQYIVLYKPSYYEILTITVDNIYDYFEFTTTWNAKYNGFDEVEEVWTKVDFVLKEPYASRVSYVNDDFAKDYNVVDNGVIEWSYQFGTFEVVLLEDQTFTLENCVSSLISSEICDGDGSFAEKSYHFVVPWGSQLYTPKQGLDVDLWRAYESNSAYDYEVVRVKLDLYLIPE